jgi:hypothetical protein
VAIAIPVFYMSVGLFVVDASTHQSLVSLASEFLPSVVVLALAILLGDTVRSRRALAAETADRLRLAEEEREAETAARVAQDWPIRAPLNEGLTEREPACRLL